MKVQQRPAGVETKTRISRHVDISRADMIKCLSDTYKWADRRYFKFQNDGIEYQEPNKQSAIVFDALDILKAIKECGNHNIPPFAKLKEMTITPQRVIIVVTWNELVIV